MSEDVSAQADQCLKNLGAVLKAAGGGHQNGTSYIVFDQSTYLEVYLFLLQLSRLLSS